MRTGASTPDSAQAWRIGTAIGDQVLDLEAAGVIDTDDMNTLMAAAPDECRALRAGISQGLREGSDKQGERAKALLPQAQVEHALPCRIGDYTDFYTGIHHATAVGRLFRPDQPLMPNYKWVPIGYHGRASSIGVSGQRFKRPRGRRRAAAPHAQQSRAGRLLDRGPARRPPHGQRLQPSAGRSTRLRDALGSFSRPSRLAARAHAGRQGAAGAAKRREADLPRRRRHALLRGYCEREGTVRIGLGEAAGTVVAH